MIEEQWNNFIKQMESQFLTYFMRKTYKYILYRLAVEISVGTGKKDLSCNPSVCASKWF